jgi:hypothetical protein
MSLITWSALLLIAHGLVHASLNSVPYGPSTPFWPSFWRAEAGHSWLLQGLGLGAEPNRIIGGLLLVIATLGFVLAGLALAGWLVPHTWWPMLGLVSAAASLLLFLLFPHPWLVVGLALSAGTVWAIWARWPAGLVGA